MSIKATVASVLQNLENLPMFSYSYPGFLSWFVIYVGESGATCHRGNLSHSHCKLKALSFMDFSYTFERNTSKRFKNIVGKVPLVLCLHSVRDCNELPQSPLPRKKFEGRPYY